MMARNYSFGQPNNYTTTTSKPNANSEQNFAKNHPNHDYQV